MSSGDAMATHGRAMQARTGLDDRSMPEHRSKRDADPRQGERFGKSLHKAIEAMRKPGAPDEDVPVAVAVNPLLTPLAVTPPDAPAVTRRADVQSVAERIDRYLRGADGAGSLKGVDGMVIRLPANAMGISHVTARMEGDVLHLLIGLDDPARNAAMQAQIGQLGQVLAMRMQRLALRLTLEAGEDATDETAADRFNPLMPGGLRHER